MNSTFSSHFYLRFLSATCYGLLAMLPAAKTTAQQPEPSLTAQEILQRMANRYASCKSYRDSGVVTTVYIESTGKEVKERRFTTAFGRPDRFRFEYRYHLPHYGLYRYIIWSHGENVHTYWDATPPAQQSPSLLSAIIAALGATDGTAYYIPVLLMPKQLEANTLADILEKPERLVDARLGDHDCFRIRGRFSESPTTLWIDKTNSLVRQINQEHDFDTYRTEKTITYAPVMDAELEDKELEFDPPATRSVPSVPEMLEQAEPPKTPGWLQGAGGAWVTAAVAVGVMLLLLIIVLAVRRAAAARG